MHREILGKADRHVKGKAWCTWQGCGALAKSAGLLGLVLLGSDQNQTKTVSFAQTHLVSIGLGWGTGLSVASLVVPPQVREYC